MARNSLSRDERLWLFARRVDELARTPAAKFGWRLGGDAGVEPDSLPTEEELIALLARFRPFFLIGKDPIRVDGTIRTLRLVCREHGDLMDALTTTATHGDPFAVNFTVTLGGRTFTPRQLTDAWVSRYFHADRIVPEMEQLPSRSWNLAAFPLGIFFRQGLLVLLSLRKIIHEAKRRGLIAAPPAPL
jgi:hypothetical protein